ncbi:Uncharacterised protein [Escherichia coli]|uniref:Uncharacterized protein n=1 Tax=Escherichia coli TaxID=562 RepID=A0A376P3C0_ECOLX|nr:Uncharacterised protein [Escherichia coli]
MLLHRKVTHSSHNMRSLQCNIMSRCNNQYSRSSRIMHLQLEQPAQHLTTLLRRNNLFSNRITPLRQNNRWQVTPGKPKSSNPLLLHSLHTRLSKLISNQPLRSRCTNSRNPLNSSLLWSLNRCRRTNPRVRRFTILKSGGSEP